MRYWLSRIENSTSPLVFTGRMGCRTSKRLKFTRPAANYPERKRFKSLFSLPGDIVLKIGDLLWSHECLLWDVDNLILCNITLTSQIKTLQEWSFHRCLPKLIKEVIPWKLLKTFTKCFCLSVSRYPSGGPRRTRLAGLEQKFWVPSWILCSLLPCVSLS